ncbi:MAG: hypothetical protein CM1200mP18_09580 [Gammaproteobacteria bacterium]|nr:MAG: hypothetical protein CM1200mP18_09580 [Gammaproteobacteria bacterium]
MMTLDAEGGGFLVDMTESVTPLEEIASVDGNESPRFSTPQAPQASQKVRC